MPLISAFESQAGGSLFSKASLAYNISSSRPGKILSQKTQKIFFGIYYEKKTYIRLSSLKSGWRVSRGNKDPNPTPMFKNTAAISDNDGIQGQTGESLKVSA